jgi:hypothetical protein
VFRLDEDGRPIALSLGAEFRNRESIGERLKGQASDPGFPSSIRCFCDNWDSVRIGKKNVAEISDAIFSRERKKCLHFAVYDTHASPSAVRDREDRRIEIIDRKKTRIIAVIAIIIAFASLVISFLASLRKILADFTG